MSDKFSEEQPKVQVGFDFMPCCYCGQMPKENDIWCIKRIGGVEKQFHKVCKTDVRLCEIHGVEMNFKGDGCPCCFADQEAAEGAHDDF